LGSEAAFDLLEAFGHAVQTFIHDKEMLRELFLLLLGTFHRSTRYLLSVIKALKSIEVRRLFLRNGKAAHLIVTVVDYRQRREIFPCWILFDFFD